MSRADGSLADLQASRVQPVRKFAHGDEHWTRQRPEDVLRGDAHWCQLKPESVPRGENCANARLTTEAVRDIRARAAAGEKQKDIAKLHNISKATVSSIVQRRRWAHID